MAQHGYLREYDEGWDRDNDERERWRGNGDRDERDRNFMFRERERERERGWNPDEDRSPEHNRGFIDRMGNRARSWMSGDDQQRAGRSDWERAPRNFSSHQDDHYRSWRDNQMKALDRDYEDYCREREQQFHQDFGSWRQNRQKQPPAGQQQGQQQQQGQPPVMELNNPAASSSETVGTQSPMADATLGTNNSENNTGGRGRR
jgi:hypothetical protein